VEHQLSMIKLCLLKSLPCLGWSLKPVAQNYLYILFSQNCVQKYRVCIRPYSRYLNGSVAQMEHNVFASFWHKHHLTSTFIRD